MTHNAEWIYWPYGRPLDTGTAIPTYTGTTDRITIGNIEPKGIAQGWQCPACKTIYGPSVQSCGCSKAK